LPTGGKSIVIALRDRYEVLAFVPSMFIAYSMPRDPAREPAIVIDAQTDDKDGHVIAHELTHVISYAAIHDQPVWFAEGIAQFFETVTIDAQHGVADVGEPLPKLVGELRRMTLLPGDQLFACKAMECRDARFYMTSAVLYGFLMNERPQQLAQLQAALATGDPNAWAKTMQDLPPDAIDRTLEAWLLRGRHQVWHYRISLQAQTAVQRALGDGDVWATRALISGEYHRADVAGYVQRALAADPTNVLARLIDTNLGHPISTADAHATVAAHPDDWRAWLLLLFTHTEGAEHDAVRAKICALSASDPAALVPPKLCPP
jgi:hypothetical protein